jgi:CheY-like chemotaxis protein
LVVDDEALLVRMVAKILSKLGYEAETMVDPTEALKAFNAAPQKYDLIITDLTMPHMTGMELATCAIRENPKIPIILMTGFFAKLTDEQLLNAGIQEVLLKPVTLKGLSQTIDRLLKK